MMGPRVMPLNIFEAVKWKTLDVFFHISLAQTGVDTTTAMFTRQDVDIHTVWSRWNTDAVYHRLLSMSWMSCCIWPWFIVMVKASYSPNFMHLIISLLTCNWLSSPGTWIVYRLSISQERPTPPIWPMRSHNKVNYREEVGKGTGCNPASLCLSCQCRKHHRSQNCSRWSWLSFHTGALMLSSVGLGNVRKRLQLLTNAIKNLNRIKHQCYLVGRSKWPNHPLRSPLQDKWTKYSLFS